MTSKPYRCPTCGHTNGRPPAIQGAALEALREALIEREDYLAAWGPGARVPEGLRMADLAKRFGVGERTIARYRAELVG